MLKFDFLEELGRNIELAQQELGKLNEEVRSGSEIKPSTMGNSVVLMKSRDFMVPLGSQDKPLDMYAKDTDSINRKERMYGVKQRLGNIIDVINGVDQSDQPRWYEKQGDKS